MIKCPQCNSTTFNESLGKCMNPACGPKPAKMPGPVAKPRPVVTNVVQQGIPIINPPKPTTTQAVVATPVKPVVTMPSFVKPTPKPVFQEPVFQTTVNPTGKSPSNGALPAWKQKLLDQQKQEEERKKEQQKLYEAMVEEIAKQHPPCVVQQGASWFFRACGKGQEPWDLLRTGGFQHRYWKTQDVAGLKKKLRSIYGTTYKGAKGYMGNYRASPGNNPGEVPFISFGKVAGDSSGASNSFWQFAIDIGNALQPVNVTWDMLGFAKPEEMHPDVGDVQLLTDTGDIDNATTVLLLHGPLPEATFLNSCPLQFVKAWTRMVGQPWQLHWRTFDTFTVNNILTITKKYGVSIEQ